MLEGAAMAVEIIELTEFQQRALDGQHGAPQVDSRTNAHYVLGTVYKMARR